jgi:hypothetical protein
VRRAARLRLSAAGLLLVAALASHHEAALAAAFASPPARHARRIKRHTSLTGVWSGAYRYPSPFNGVDQVPFNARLEEIGASFSGDIDEPNTYAHPSAPRLYAQVTGVRSGLDVRFTKQMDGTGGAAHAIAYEGTADPDLNRIDGAWRLDGLTGTFFMERAGVEVEAEAAASRAASATG